MDSLDAAEVAAYLERIGAPTKQQPDAAYLRRLHQLHLYAVPFENLSIHLGERVVLQPQALVEKIVARRRGGFCYELNGAFAALLEALGYRVTRLAGRAYGFHNKAFGPPYGHLALRVESQDAGDGGPWLADVGFGRHTIFPLRLDDRKDQDDPGGVFRVEETDEGDLDVFGGGELQYRLEQRPRALADFEATCWWQQTSPGSHFTQSLVCSLAGPDGRVTLSGRTLIVTNAQGRSEEYLADEATVLAAYREHFGIVLEHEPVLKGD
jgi:N-hydroxyarylamine O-acetyltransferase